MTIKMPHALLDAIIAEFQLKNDAALSNFLDVPPPHVSRMRHVRYGISAEMILRVYDKTGWSIEKIRSYLRGPE
jgi:plasmid maintenance system antidote protein VapI